MNILDEVKKIRDYLKENMDDQQNPIDCSMPMIPPYKGNSAIKLIVLGQDPTIQNIESRKQIKITLNLDREGSLKIYLSKICDGIGITLDNIYATNIFKYFYTNPPAETLDILRKHLANNIDVLNEELKPYPNVPVITLGEPVLELIAKESANRKVRFYWGYDDNNFYVLRNRDNILDRLVFPFPHQPSLRKEHYSRIFDNYIAFLKHNIGVQF